MQRPLGTNSWSTALIWCWGYVECVLLIAGLQPHLAWVRLIRLWGCTPVVQSNHGTQDKPAITTHTQERATVTTAHYICSACTILPFPINGYSQTTTCVLCQRGPAKATYVVCSRKQLLQSVRLLCCLLECPNWPLATQRCAAQYGVTLWAERLSDTLFLFTSCRSHWKHCSTRCHGRGTADSCSLIEELSCSVFTWCNRSAYLTDSVTR